MNILILSAGTRNKLVQYFKKELGENGNIIATDCSELAPAVYEADKFYKVPRIDSPNYIDEILEICKNEKIDTLFALIDPELSLIAKNINRFYEIGIKPIISDYEAVELSFNKYEMYKFLIENNIKTPKTYISLNDFLDDLDKKIVKFPVFVKPIKGSASINITKINDKEELEFVMKKYDNLIIQEFMDGQEIGADVYIDMVSEEVIAIFTKEKIKMRAGETDKAVSFKDEKLFEFIEDFVKKAGFKGIIDIDIFKINNEYYISEVNPRFGGGYPHAYEAGVNVPKMIINNINGIENEEQIGNYEDNVYMMKYNEVMIIKDVK